MNKDTAAIYERAKRLGNLALWTVSLQRRRLNSTEPEDTKFIFRRWSDFQFLIVALTRLRGAAKLAAQVPQISNEMSTALQEFDKALPHLKEMRNTAEHIDDYALNKGRNKTINRKSLEVASLNGERWEWLGFELDAGTAEEAACDLYAAIKKCSTLV